MRMKVIALIGLAVLLAASPASAAALFGSGGSGSGGGDFSLGNGVVSGNFTPAGGGDTLPFSNEPLSGFDFVGSVDCASNCNTGTYEGTITAVVPTSEPLAFLTVGLGLLGARYIRRRA